MYKKHQDLLFFIGLLLVVNIIDAGLFLILNYFDFLTYSQLVSISILTFPVIFGSAILYTLKRFKIKLEFRGVFLSPEIIIVSFFLFLMIFIVQNAIDKSFIDALVDGDLKFLERSMGAPEGSHGYLVIIVSVIFAPIVEEIFYRGIIFKKMLESYSLTISILITSFLFALMHWNLESLLAYFLIGLAFTYIYYLTKALWLNILLHGFYNLLSSCFILTTYEISDPWYRIGLFIYIVCAIGIYLSVKRLRFLVPNI